MNAMLLAAAMLTASPEATIEKFLTEWRAGRVKEMRAMLRDDVQRLVTEAQVAAYVAAHKRAMRDLVEWEKPELAKEDEYESTLTFTKGKVRGTFGASDGRIDWWALELPEKTVMTFEEGEVLPVAKEMLAAATREGVASLVERVADDYLLEVGQTRESVVENLTRIADVLGPLSSFELNAPAELAGNCREVTGKGKFEHGQAALKVHLCWAGGLWNLRHTLITPDVTPAMVERMFARLIEGAPKATCPKNAPFPVGGDIICRIEVAGERPRNATIRRTGESSWEIVALDEAKP